MKIEAVDFFSLAMPEITTEADGSVLLAHKLLTRLERAATLCGGASPRVEQCHARKATRCSLVPTVARAPRVRG